MMLRQEFKKEALQFFGDVKGDFEDRHKSEITVLETVHDVSRLSDPEIAKFLKNKFFVKMSRQAYTIFKFQIDFSQLNLILHIVNLNIQFEVTSEYDIILDRKSGNQAIMVEPGQEISLQPLVLNRLKEFNPDAWEVVPTSIDEAEQLKRKPVVENSVWSVGVPLPQIDRSLQEMIKTEFGQQVKLSERNLPSVGTIALQFSYRRVICTALSDSGEIMACGTADSTIKVFWLNPAKVREMSGINEGQTSYLSSDGLKVQLYT